MRRIIDALEEDSYEEHYYSNIAPLYLAFYAVAIQEIPMTYVLHGQMARPVMRYEWSAYRGDKSIA